MDRFKFRAYITVSYEDDENYEEVITLKEFQNMFNRPKRNGLDNVDRIEFIVE